MRCACHLTRCTLVLLALLAISPATRSAAAGEVWLDANTAHVQAREGETSSLTVSIRGDRLVIEDSTAVLTQDRNAHGDYCALPPEAEGHAATCPAERVEDLKMTLGDGDDSVTVDLPALMYGSERFGDRAPFYPTRLEIHGGPGADRIHGQAGEAELWGDEGDDTLEVVGGGGWVRIPPKAHGGEGNDVVTAVGGHGALLTGEAGDDALSTSGQTSLRPGYPGFNYTVHNLLEGGEGADLLRVAPVARVPTFNSDGSQHVPQPYDSHGLYGGPGNDVLEGSTGSIYMVGDAGADRLYGGVDEDHLQGGGDDDVIDGRGAEQVPRPDAHVGGQILPPDPQDNVFCGRGRDLVVERPNDKIWLDCESAREYVTDADLLHDSFASYESFLNANIDIEEVTPSGIVALRVPCPAGTHVCSGTVSLFGSARPVTGRTASASRAAGRQVVLGRRAFAVRSGRVRQVSVRIAPSRVRSLRRAGRFRATAVFRLRYGVKSRTRVVPRLDFRFPRRADRR